MSAAQIAADPSTIASHVEKFADKLAPEHSSDVKHHFDVLKEQFKCLSSAIETFKEATGKDPLLPADLKSPEKQQPLPVGDPDATNDSTHNSPQTAHPPPEWEELAVTLFSIADTLPPTMMHALAHILGCNEHLLRTDYNKQRTSVRNFLQRVQKKAANTQLQSNTLTESMQPSPALDDPSSQQLLQDEQALEKLQGLLDDSGGISQGYLADKLVMQMQSASSYSLKSAQLAAILASTNRNVLMRFTVSRFSDAVDGWVRTAEEDNQTTFLLQVLQALANVPAAITSTRTNLQKTIRRLTHSRCTRISTRATALLQLWQAQESGNTSGADALRSQILSSKQGQENKQPVPQAATGQLYAVGKAHAHGGGAKGSSHKRGPLQRPLFTHDPEREKKRMALMGTPWHAQLPTVGAGAAAAAMPPVSTAEPPGFQRTGNGLAPKQQQNLRYAPPPSTPLHPAYNPLPPVPQPRQLPAPSDRGTLGRNPRDSERPALPIPVKPIDPHTAAAAQAAAPPAAARRRGPSHPDMEAAEQLYQQRHVQWTVKRQQWASADLQRQHDMLRSLPAMAPTIYWYQPVHLSPPDPTSPPGQGEESAERQIQLSREATTHRAHYTRWEDIPPSPLEFPQLDPPVGNIAHIPFTPADPAEDKVQNASMWAKGVRLGQYVRVPDSMPVVEAPQYVAVAPGSGVDQFGVAALQYGVVAGHGGVAAQVLERQQLLALQQQQQQQQRITAAAGGQQSDLNPSAYLSYAQQQQQQQQLLSMQQQQQPQQSAQAYGSQQQYAVSLQQPQQQPQQHYQHETDQYRQLQHDQQLLQQQQQQQQQQLLYGYYPQYGGQQQGLQQPGTQYLSGSHAAGYDASRQHNAGYGYMG